MDKSKATGIVIVVMLVVAFIAMVYVFTQVGGVVEKRHSFTFTVKVIAAGDFTCVITPEEQSGVKGELLSYTIATQALQGYDAGIYFEVTGLPTSAVTFSKNPVNAGESVTMIIDTSVLKSNTAFVCTLEAVGVAPVSISN